MACISPAAQKADSGSEEEVLESWRRYSRALQEAAGGQLCYVTGAHLPAAEGHPKLIGSQKLISSKEDGTLKYLGHFAESAQALSVSSEASAKAHNMIRWLMGRKGVRSYIYGMWLLVWADNGARRRSRWRMTATGLRKERRKSLRRIQPKPMRRSWEKLPLDTETR